MQNFKSFGPLETELEKVDIFDFILKLLWTAAYHFTTSNNVDIFNPLPQIHFFTSGNMLKPLLEMEFGTRKMTEIPLLENLFLINQGLLNQGIITVLISITATFCVGLVLQVMLELINSMKI